MSADLVGTLQRRLEETGLRLQGAFYPEPRDEVPPLPDGREAATLLLVSQTGSAFWDKLQTQAEFPGPDPVDRWNARLLGELATDLGFGLALPFGGPPYHPFQRWALRADPELAISPLGILIHPEHGLWLALRGALLLAQRVACPPPGARTSPCAGCAAKPCLATCPVSAFKPSGYDVRACRTCLATLSGQACMIQGCLARNACPVGREHRYPTAELQHHMRAFARG